MRWPQTIQAGGDSTYDTHFSGISRIYTVLIRKCRSKPHVSATSPYHCDSSGTPLTAHSCPAATTSNSRPEASRTSGCPSARIIQEAEGYRQRVIEQAEGDAAYFRQLLAEYSRAPQVTRERLYLDAMQQILGNTSKVLIDQKGGNNLIYLPLDRIMQMSGAAPSKDTAAKPPEAPPEPSTARSREAFRSREREAR